MDITKNMLDKLVSDEREVKLPKWAQEQLDLARRVAKESYKRGEQSRLDTDPEGASAVLDISTGMPVGLGKDARVEFRVGEHTILCRVKHDSHGTYLELWTADGSMLVWTADGSMLVRSYSGNVMHALVEPR